MKQNFCYWQTSSASRKTEILFLIYTFHLQYRSNNKHKLFFATASPPRWAESGRRVDPAHPGAVTWPAVPHDIWRPSALTRPSHHRRTTAPLPRDDA